MCMHTYVLSVPPHDTLPLLYHTHILQSTLPRVSNHSYIHSCTPLSLPMRLSTAHTPLKTTIRTSLYQSTGACWVHDDTQPPPSPAAGAAASVGKHAVHAPPLEGVTGCTVGETQPLPQPLLHLRC